MRCFGFQWIIAIQQGWRIEGVAHRALADQLEIVAPAHKQLRGLGQRHHVAVHFGFLRGAKQWAHAHPVRRRVADRHFGKPRTEGRGHRLHPRGGNQDAPDGRALLTGLGGHLACDFLDEEVEFRVAGAHRFTQDATIQRVRFLVERNAFPDDVRVRLEHLTSSGRTGKRHHVLLGQVIEQIAVLPQINCSDPSGRIPEAMISRTIASVR